nr:hypothetical protein CFP56_33783 [Quercus suber]
MQSRSASSSTKLTSPSSVVYSLSSSSSQRLHLVYPSTKDMYLYTNFATKSLVDSLHCEITLSPNTSRRSHLKQHAFRTRHLPLFPLYHARRHPNRHGQGLERALGAMMIILPAQAIHMHRDASALGERLQTMRDHLTTQIPDLLTRQPELDDAERAITQIDDGARQGLIERGVRVPEPREPGGAAQRALERLAQRDARVLRGVVVVDVQVAARRQRQRPPGVLRQRVQHVVQEADAGVDGDGLGGGGLRGVRGVGRRGERLEDPAVEVQRELDLGLVGVARERGGAGRSFGRRHGCGRGRLLGSFFSDEVLMSEGRMDL